ncbi:MAG TPA: WG repeat-containing protein, partial [Spirochaetota bacterium]|nr:WG repeat-containing protein [Spirochaetota bacterium]
FYGKINYSLEGEKWGIKDYDGKVVFEPSFDRIVRFDYHDDKLKEKTYFQKNGKMGMIDKNYNILIEPKYDSLSEFTNDLTRSERGGYIYLIDDKTGEEKYGPFKEIGWGDEYITMRSTDNLYGYITNGGETVISPRFHDATRFIKTIAGVKINNKWGVIDLSGNLIVKPYFDSVSVEETGIIRCNVKNKIGYINTVGLKIFEIWKPSN